MPELTPKQIKTGGEKQKKKYISKSIVIFYFCHGKLIINKS
jgi:hypothetical protein